jgi:hypothetical protein
LGIHAAREPELLIYLRLHSRFSQGCPIGRHLNL